MAYQDSRRKQLQGIELVKEMHQSRTTHAGLWLDRYLCQQEVKESASPEQSRDRQSGEQKDSRTNPRSEHIKAVSLLPVPAAYRISYQYWMKELKDFGAESHMAKVKGRMIIGLGDESVLETSIQLHHTYGTPYIPGSALKGLAASYASQQLGIERTSPEYQVIFGTTEDAGFITFFDALYIPGSAICKERVLYPDIITVHHPDYYQNGEKAPTDTNSPNPIAFLSAVGSYQIALAAPDLEQPHRDRWLRTTFEILARALEEMGIGAKTSSGYGRMSLELMPMDKAHINK
jgi:CRISPR-associated protein Cmr6